MSDDPGDPGEHRFQIVDLPQKERSIWSRQYYHHDLLVALRKFLIQHPGEWVEWPIKGTDSTRKQIHARIIRMKSFGPQYQGRCYRNKAYVRYVGDQQD